MDVVSTAEVSVGERFAFWREVNSKLWVPYDLRCDRQLESGFRAQVGVSEFGPVQATLMTRMPHSAVVGGPRPIAVATPLPGAFLVGNRLFVRKPGPVAQPVSDRPLSAI